MVDIDDCEISEASSSWVDIALSDPESVSFSLGNVASEPWSVPAALLAEVLNNECNCSNNGATLAASSTLTLGACCCNLSRRILSTRGAQVGFRDWCKVKPRGEVKRLEQLGLRHESMLCV